MNRPCRRQTYAQRGRAAFRQELRRDLRRPIHPIFLIACLFLAGLSTAWAKGKGESGRADFGRASIEVPSPGNTPGAPSAGVDEGEAGGTDRVVSDATETRIDRTSDPMLSKSAKVVDGTIGTWERNFARFGWTLADWESQRQEAIRRITRASPAHGVAIQRFVAVYGRARDYEGRRSAIVELLNAVSAPAIVGEEFNKETFPKHLNQLYKAAPRETVKIFMSGSRLLDIEALLYKSARVLAEAECSDQNLEDSGRGRYALAPSLPDDHCYETAGR